jgi:hypothetical protein
MVMKNCNAGKENFSHYRYPFIRSASSFSGSSSFSSSSGGSNAYDYIIVGGGTAGCPLAATLSQNFSVLLLERGGVPFSNANISFLKNFHIPNSLFPQMELLILELEFWVVALASMLASTLEQAQGIYVLVHTLTCHTMLEEFHRLMN